MYIWMLSHFVYSSSGRWNLHTHLHPEHKHNIIPQTSSSYIVWVLWVIAFGDNIYWLRIIIMYAKSWFFWLHLCVHIPEHCFKAWLEPYWNILKSLFVLFALSLISSFLLYLWKLMDNEIIVVVLIYMFDVHYIWQCTVLYVMFIICIHAY